MFNLKLNLQKVGNSIKKAVQKAFNKPIENSIDDIEKSIKQKLKVFFKQTSFYHSATDGYLKAELGFPDDEAYDIINSLIEDIVDEINVNYYPYDNKAGGRIIVSMKDGYIDRLTLFYADIITENDYSLPWISWLLKEGSAPIITDYRFLPKPGHGRSLGGIMVSKGSWRVPPEFSGTEDNNIITRSLEDFKKEIEEEIILIVNKNV